MSKNWLKEHRQDAYYKKAKQNGYRSRAAFKLQQLNKKFRVIKPGYSVLDLGAAPGGWSQVALEIVGDKGKVVGVDVDPITTLPGAVFIRGDMTAEETLDKIDKELDIVNVVISDMSPNISGQYSIDQARSVHLAEMALKTAERFLKSGGNFVVKIFEGEDFPEFIQKLKTKFEFVKVFSPPASRSQSSEIYVVCKNYFKR
jgi:23S rRNA (uridine2552-2'-O)-methyltransferase